MPDGKEESEQPKARLEAEKKSTRPSDRYDEDPVYEGQPERRGS